MPLFVCATRYESSSSVSVLCLNCVDQLSRDDEQVQAAPHIHQKCCHQELLREVHQLHSGLHLYLQTGMDRRCCKLYIFCPWNLQYQVFLICVVLKSLSCVSRWTCYKSFMKPHWRLWKMPKMTDCGSKRTQRYTEVSHWSRLSCVIISWYNRTLEMLFFVICLQLGKLYLEREEYGKLQKILRQLHQSCQVIKSFSFFLFSL